MKTALMVVGDAGFVQGVLCLMHSLSSRNDLRGVTKILYADTPLPALTSLFDEIRRVPEADYRGISRPNWKPRFRKTFYKFEAFRMKEFDRVIVLDADILCLGDISLFLRSGFTEPLWVADDRGRAPTPGKYKNSNRPIFNSGVMVVNKPLLSDETFRGLIKVSRSGSSYDGSDQGALNEFVHINKIPLRPLSTIYNCLKRVYKSSMWPMIENDIRLLHFVGKKPWEHISSRQWSVDEKGYEPIEQLWLKEFNSVKHASHA